MERRLDRNAGLRHGAAFEKHQDVVQDGVGLGLHGVEFFERFAVTRRSQQLFPIVMPWRSIGPILGWMAAGWALGTAVQRLPATFPWPARLGCLGVFYGLPFLFGALKPADLRGVFGAARPARPAPGTPG